MIRRVVKIIKTMQKDTAKYRLSMSLLLIMLIGMLVGCSSNQKAYDEAEEFFNAGSLYDAAVAFESLGNYGNASNRAVEVREYISEFNVDNTKMSVYLEDVNVVDGTTTIDAVIRLSEVTWHYQTIPIMIGPSSIFFEDGTSIQMNEEYFASVIRREDGFILGVRYSITFPTEQVATRLDFFFDNPHSESSGLVAGFDMKTLKAR